MDCHLMEIRHPAGGYGVCLSHTVVRGSHVDVRDAGIRVSHEGFDGGCRPFPAVTPRFVTLEMFKCDKHRKLHKIRKREALFHTTVH